MSSSLLTMSKKSKQQRRQALASLKSARSGRLSSALDLALPDNGIVRARARVRSGLSNGSSGWVASTRLYQFTPLSAPVLTISGKKKILTSAKKVTVKGTASDVDGDLVSVRFLDSRQRGRAFRAVRGLAVWSAKAVLKDGRNKVLVEARDASGRRATGSVTILKR